METMVKRGERPAVETAAVPADILALISTAWHQNKDQRPAFALIVASLMGYRQLASVDVGMVTASADSTTSGGVPIKDNPPLPLPGPLAAVLEKIRPQATKKGNAALKRGARDLAVATRLLIEFSRCYQTNEVFQDTGDYEKACIQLRQNKSPGRKIYGESAVSEDSSPPILELIVAASSVVGFCCNVLHFLFVGYGAKVSLAASSCLRRS
jgi:hypothetical protein